MPTQARDQSKRRVRVSGPARPIPLDQKLLLDVEDMASLAGLTVGAMRGLIRDGRGPDITWLGKHMRATRRAFALWIEEMSANSGARA